MNDIISFFYPETRAAGFTRYDGTVQFYQRVQALMRPDSVVLDFGAGRGVGFNDASPYRRRLRDLRGEGRRVIGVDVDPVVLGNPAIDEAVVINPSAPLPFADGSFDLIVSDWTFEHIAEAAKVTGELDRVLKIGGWICARTPNLYGYVALANRMVPDSFTKRLLSFVQTDREARDIFPAQYRMNTLKTLRALFPIDRYEHASFAYDSEPQYHFNRYPIFVLLLLLHALTPPALRTTLMSFAQKRAQRGERAPVSACRSVDQGSS